MGFNGFVLTKEPASSVKVVLGVIVDWDDEADCTFSVKAEWYIEEIELLELLEAILSELPLIGNTLSDSGLDDELSAK